MATAVPALQPPGSAARAPATQPPASTALHEPVQPPAAAARAPRPQSSTVATAVPALQPPAQCCKSPPSTGPMPVSPGLLQLSRPTVQQRQPQGRLPVPLRPLQYSRPPAQQDQLQTAPSAARPSAAQCPTSARTATPRVPRSGSRCECKLASPVQAHGCGCQLASSAWACRFARCFVSPVQAYMLGSRLVECRNTSSNQHPLSKLYRSCSRSEC